MKLSEYRSARRVALLAFGEDLSREDRRDATRLILLFDDQDKRDKLILKEERDAKEERDSLGKDGA